MRRWVNLFAICAENEGGMRSQKMRKHKLRVRQFGDGIQIVENAQ